MYICIYVYIYVYIYKHIIDNNNKNTTRGTLGVRFQAKEDNLKLSKDFYLKATAKIWP